MTAQRGSRFAVMLLAGVATAVLTGCGSPAGEPGAATADIVAASSDSDVVLPVDAYGYTAIETGQLLLAKELLAADCQRAHGVRDVATPDRAAFELLTRSRQRDLGSYGGKRRYGVIDAGAAATYGYHIPSTVDGSTPNEKDKIPGSSACLDLATASLTGGGSFGSADLVRTISWDSYRYSLRSPELAAVTKQWSSCMQAKGYRESNLVDAGEGFDLDTGVVKPEEIATASADVACKRTAGVIDTWRAVEQAYQDAEIAKHARELADVKAAHDDCMKRVAEVVARHG
ncbi:hypothetical protein [Kutzneria sp. NPDC052558]|uniref:hypothetical protein n=1 Tax=Kutzneria sp. NPDC052558 TaxID=3364121 RepID=UPI0037C70928